MDRNGPSRYVGLGLAGVLAGFLLLWAGQGVIAMLVLGTIVFDLGVRTAQVANQARIIRLDPLRPAQLNSTYMVIYFVGGSLGAAAGGPIVSTLGWPIGASAAALAIAAALVLYAVQARASAARPVET